MRLSSGGSYAPHNALLWEAAEDNSIVDTAVKAMKRLLNVAKLAKYRSTDANSRFYGAFFTCSLEGDVRPTMAQWGSIYTTLLTDDNFCAELAKFMLMYQPLVYAGMFGPLWNTIQTELAALKKNRIQYLSMQKSFLAMMQMRLNGVGNLIKAQITNNPGVMKFITTVDQVLSHMVFDLGKLVTAEMAKAVNPEDIVSSTRVDTGVPLPEDAVELITMLETGEAWIQNRANELSMNEGIFGDAAEKMKGAMVAIKKAERDFDERVMTHVRRMREERRNRKHAEIVGEALRVNNEVKRVLKAGAIGLLNPTWGVIAYLSSIILDRQTDRRDRKVLMDQLRDELEIIEEKISMAERQGDDKARIELIRFRQKLMHEYERVAHVRYTAKVRKKLGIGGYE